MIRVDTTALTDLIDRCLGLAADARLAREAQASFLADGKRLRALLLNLLSAQFDDGTQAVLEVNQEITNVNRRLSNPIVTLANIAATRAAVSSIIALLDKLVAVATMFIEGSQRQAPDIHIEEF
jgi:geranylgeranyl pyrophosphate synthase